MELILNTDLEIGQQLFYLETKEKTIYAPCHICNNERKITITMGGKEFELPCPQCSGKQIKGDTSKTVKVKRYSVADCHVTGFAYGISHRAPEAKWRLVTSKYRDVEPKTLLATDYYSEVQLFTNEDLAEKRMKEFNKIEKRKCDDFLKGTGKM